MLGTRGRNRGRGLMLGALALLSFRLYTGAGVMDPDTLVRRSERVKTFDPILCSDVAASRAVSLVYESLLGYGYIERPYRLVPVLAASMPEVSADGLSYRFRLKQGVRFADDPCFPGGQGREIVADDVRYSIMRMADARNASTGWWLLRDRIVGLDAFRDRTVSDPDVTYADPVEGLECTGQYAITIKLIRPAPQVLWALAMTYTAVVPREAVDDYGDRFALNPVGSGPYRLEQWRRQYSMTFKRNPNWQRRVLVGESAELPVATFEKIRFMVIGDRSTSWLAFLQGQLDYTGEISRDNWAVVVTEDGKLAPSLARRGIQLQRQPSMITSYLGVNMDDPVLGKNRKLRQALNCAFDGEKWARFFNHRRSPASGAVPPGIAGQLDEPAPYRFDLEKARRLLVEAGYPGGKDPATGKRLVLKLDLGRTDTQTRESTELLISMMDEIGIALKPAYYNWGAFLRRISQRQSQMFRIAWVADYPDAENFLQLFYGPNDSPGPNRSNYRNADFDKLYERAMSTTDERERLDLYGQMQRRVREDCPWVFLSHREEYALSHKWIENYRVHDFPYGMERYYSRKREEP